jgi:hypothetical protein
MGKLHACKTPPRKHGWIDRDGYATSDWVDRRRNCPGCDQWWVYEISSANTGWIRMRGVG